jgi:hypothetical protein
MEQGNDHHPEDADPDCERDGNISSNDCETTNPGVPIRELLIKAKKAASSLWTVLHAKYTADRWYMNFFITLPHGSPRSVR